MRYTRQIQIIGIVIIQMVLNIILMKDFLNLAELGLNWLIIILIVFWNTSCLISVWSVHLSSQYEK